MFQNYTAREGNVIPLTESVATCKGYLTEENNFQIGALPAVNVHRNPLVFYPALSPSNEDITPTI